MENFTPLIPGQFLKQPEQGSGTPYARIPVHSTDRLKRMKWTFFTISFDILLKLDRNKYDS